MTLVFCKRCNIAYTDAEFSAHPCPAAVSEDDEIRWLWDIIQRAVMTAFDAHVLSYPGDRNFVATVAMFREPRIEGKGASRLEALRVLYLRTSQVLHRRYDAISKALWLLSEKPPCKPPLNDPPDEDGDPMDVPIDHTPEECE